ncbi:MAG: PAAR domain-containing protein [Bdellovibrionales bacterium]|nr:PAAR domain-containing protein [Bdellovibrionales bacterium]
MRRSVSLALLIVVLVAGHSSKAIAAGPAARLGDPTNHGGMITTGTPTVLISGQPAARLTDFVVCPQISNVSGVPVPHVGGTISSGLPTVLVGGLPAATVGDLVIESGAQSSISSGAPTVVIGTSGAN